MAREPFGSCHLPSAGPRIVVPCGASYNCRLARVLGRRTFFFFFYNGQLRQKIPLHTHDEEMNSSGGKKKVTSETSSIRTPRSHIARVAPSPLPPRVCNPVASHLITRNFSRSLYFLSFRLRLVYSRVRLGDCAVCLFFFFFIRGSSSYVRHRPRNGVCYNLPILFARLDTIVI